MATGIGEATADLDFLIEELRRRRWVLYLWGPRDDPGHFAAVYPWPGRDVDVLILREDGSGSAYRTVRFDERNMFRPEVVGWQYHHADAYRVFRAVYTLPEPGCPRGALPAGGAPQALPPARRPAGTGSRTSTGDVPVTGPRTHSHWL